MYLKSYKQQCRSEGIIHKTSTFQPLLANSSKMFKDPMWKTFSSKTISTNFCVFMSSVMLTMFSSFHHDVNNTSWFLDFHTVCGWVWLTTFQNSWSVPSSQVKWEGIYLFYSPVQIDPTRRSKPSSANHIHTPCKHWRNKQYYLWCSLSIYKNTIYFWKPGTLHYSTNILTSNCIISQILFMYK